MLQQQAIQSGISPDIVDERIANAWNYDDPDAEFYQFMLELQRSKHEKEKQMLTYSGGFTNGPPLRDTELMYGNDAQEDYEYPQE
jgi:hypothetical protein